MIDAVSGRRENLKHRRGVVTVQPGGCTRPVRDVYLLIGVASLEYTGSWCVEIPYLYMPVDFRFASGGERGVPCERRHCEGRFGFRAVELSLAVSRE